VVSQEPDEVSERSIVVDKIDKIDKIMNGAMTQQTAAPKRKILKAKRRALQPVDKTARVEETAPEDLAEQRSWWQRLFCSSRKRKHSAIHPLSSQLSDDGVVGDHGRVDSTESCSSVHTASPNNATFVSAVDPPRETISLHNVRLRPVSTDPAEEPSAKRQKREVNEDEASENYAVQRSLLHAATAHAQAASATTVAGPAFGNVVLRAPQERFFTCAPAPAANTTGDELHRILAARRKKVEQSIAQAQKAA